MVKDGIYTKWKIKGLQNYFFGNDLNLYRAPFVSKGKFYGWKLIKIQNPNRYKIAGVWYSQNQLRSKLEIDELPKEIFKINDLPF